MSINRGLGYIAIIIGGLNFFYLIHNHFQLSSFYVPDDGEHNAKANNIIGVSNSGSVKCTNDGGECKGSFNYSGPNHSPNATRLLNEAVDMYKYGNERHIKDGLIFFPNHTRSEECIQEWENARNGRGLDSKRWNDRGMSAWGEDLIIFKKFYDGKDHMNNSHVYMEIGAHDGVRESNTRFFDVCLGWQGLLVEPHPDNYKLMEKLRPNAHHLNLAPSCNTTSDMVKFPRHTYTNAVANEEGNVLEIHCGPLSYYLKQLGISHIDFWSLDVEGSELNLLKTVDFDEVHIDVIIAESENRLADKQKMGEEVREFLKEKDYVVFPKGTIHKSDVFLHKRKCSEYSHFPECQRILSSTS